MDSFWDRFADPEVLARGYWGWEGDSFKRRTYGEIFEAGRRLAAALRQRGVGPGDVVPAVLTNGPSVHSGIAGVWMAGATLASLPIISRGMSPESYGDQILGLISLVGAEFVLVEERFISLLPADLDVGVEIVSYERLIEHPDRLDPQFPEPLDTALIQFSSGTTGEPRGAELTTEALEAQLRELTATLEVDEGDVGYTWLPFSHDMGLIGCGLLTWYAGMESVVSTPERFLQSPRTWMQDCADFGVTVTAAPPFALDLAARTDRIKPLRSRLALRLCIVGAERIEWASLSGMASTFEDRGLDLSVFTPAYGLAEATLAVTTGDPRATPAPLDVDAFALAADSVEVVDADHENALRIVSSGTPLPGTEVTVDGQVGEIRVTSPSLAKGYFKNESATAERFLPDGLRTADLGFQHEGELFVTGRSDDLIIVGGRNVYVEALEEELGDRKGIRKGNCAIVDVPVEGRTRIGVVAEVRPADEPDPTALGELLKRQVLESLGVSVDEVVLLPPGGFPKTPSGKVQRYRCRQLLGGGAGARG
jgi:fatty-acyl-CoA synthase